MAQQMWSALTVLWLPFFLLSSHRHLFIHGMDKSEMRDAPSETNDLVVFGQEGVAAEVYGRGEGCVRRKAVFAPSSLKPGCMRSFFTLKSLDLFTRGKGRMLNVCCIRFPGNRSSESSPACDTDGGRGERRTAQRTNSTLIGSTKRDYQTRAAAQLASAVRSIFSARWWFTLGS